MHWIAPSEKDTATTTLEKRLWDAADQFRANSGLKAQEYSAPVLGLIFLRFAEVRFAAQRAHLEKAGASSRRGSRVDEPAASHAEGILYLPAEARFDDLLNLPEAEDIGGKVNAAMRDIEKHNPQRAGVLPKTYNLFTSTLLKELLKKVSEIPATVDYDAFGRIYEYCLGEFARTEGQKGGEFYTPSCIVRLLTEVIEPYHGRILDPACGSGGMFVSSARFVAEHKANPAAELSIHGVEKTDETGRLCRLNLAVHGLEGDIRHGGNVNSYDDDPHEAPGRFDFVLANPPFNVNAVDKERLKDMVGPGRRFPFGLPRTDNANYLWIQLFHSALNDKGRAGFVMANSASDARASEQDIRQKLVESRTVDVMVAVGPNLFYTVTLPCILWFFDKGKGKTPRTGTVLFIDARHIYRQVDRAHREWTHAQIGFLANLVRLYRGEALDFTLGGDDARTKLIDVFTPSPLAGEGKGEGEICYRDIPGLCKAATLKEIAAQGWSLNPGRYVGVAAGEAVSDEDFKAQLETLNEELETLNTQARDLEQTIASEGYPVYSGYRQVGFSSRYHYAEPEIVVVARGGGGTGDIQMTPPFCFLTNLSIAILLETSEVFKPFLFHRLSATTLWELRTGSAPAQITIEHLKDFEVEFPPLPVQRRIAGILSAYDELMENSQRRIRLLEAMARALSREWFVYFRFPGHQQLRRVASPLGEIPQGWKIGRLDDVLVLQRGFDLPKADRVEGTVPIYAATGVTGFHNEAKVKAPGVVTGRSGAIGDVLYVQEDFWPLNTALWVKEFPKAEPLYAYYVLSSLDLKQFNSGAAVPTLNRNDIHGFNTLIPPRPLQKRFQEVASTMLAQTRTLELQIQTLRRTRDLLLPRLLSGQVELTSVSANGASSTEPRATP